MSKTNRPQALTIFVKPAGLLMGLLLVMLASTSVAQGELIDRPDDNTLWVEDFSDIRFDKKRRQGWWHFDQISVEIVDGSRARLRQTASRSTGNLQRYVPYDLRPGQDYRYLQIRLGQIENIEHYVTLTNASTGGASLGRPFTGITTIDLAAQQALAGKRGTFALTLTHRGNRGDEPGGWLDVDWIRVVKVPHGGLTLTLHKQENPAQAPTDSDQPATAQVGDTIEVRYLAQQSLPQSELKVRFFTVSGMVPYNLNETGNTVVLTDQGQQDGLRVYAGSVTITEQALSLTGNPNALIATAEVGEDETHALTPFAIDVQTQQDLSDVLAASTPRAREFRTLWLERTQGENLALGKPVQFSRTPNYRLTHDDNDPLDLTDGNLSSRTDDRIWFARDAVGWQNGADQGVNMMIDLGEVQPIDRVVFRVLGGGAQTSLLFPRELAVVASKDGQTFYRVDSLNKLMPGEKDQADDPGVYYLPEEGHAYVYPFIFKNLNVQARYIGIQAVGASSSLFADELAIIKGDFAPAHATALSSLPRTDVIMSGLVLKPFHNVVAIASNIRTPHWFHFSDMREQPDQKQPLTFVLELPDGITLDGVRGNRAAIEQEAITRNGQAYVRWKVTNPAISHGYNVGDFHFRITAQPSSLAGTHAYLYVESQGYEPNVITAPIEVVEIPQVPKLEHLHVSLAWNSGNPELWPDYYTAWQHMGFNVVSTFPRYWKDEQPSQETLAHLDQARSLGMKVLYNESPFHVMVNRRRNQDEIYSQLPSGPSRNPCPSYRGQYYQEEIERVGKLAATTQFDYIFHDIELWYRGGQEANTCQRCVARMKETGLELPDFLSSLGAEMLADLNASVRRHTEAAGLKMPTVAIYNIHAARPIYHFVLDFNQLYPSHIDMAQPSLYVRGNAPLVRDTIRTNYERLGSRQIIPWLTAGTYGEFEPFKLEHKILEALLNGAKGITYYWFGNFDNAWDWYYHARPLSLLAPHEQLLVDGTPQQVQADNATLSYTAWGTDSEMILLAGNYHASRQTVTRISLPSLPPGQTWQVRDLYTNQAVDVAGNVLASDVPAQQVRLYHVKAATSR